MRGGEGGDGGRRGSNNTVSVTRDDSTEQQRSLAVLKGLEQVGMGYMQHSALPRAVWLSRPRPSYHHCMYSTSFCVRTITQVSL